MKYFHEQVIAIFIMLHAPMVAISQQAPAAPERPWQVTPNMQPGVPSRHVPAFVPDPLKMYTLPELVDIAEQNNPDTRVAWENAKARAADLGVSKASLYPTLAALALAQSDRTEIFFSPDFIRQTSGTFSPALVLDYIIFDFGRRLQEVAISRSNLLAANFLFNDTHRKVIFQVMEAYYRVLNSKGQEDAQQANLKNAQTVQDAAEARLNEGLATLPDVLEARSAAAQADYDVALNAQRSAEAKLVVVGEAAPSAKNADELAAQRAVNTKAYLVEEKGVDASRISVRTGPAGTDQVETYLVPAGANVENDVTGITPFDESAIKAQSRKAPAPRKRHPAKKAAAPQQ
jgi:outer membrane protein